MTTDQEQMAGDEGKDPSYKDLVPEAEKPKDKPPKPSKAKRGRPTKATATKGIPLKDPLYEFIAAIGAFVLPFDVVCGTSILEGSERLAESLDVLARQNDSVRRALEVAVTGGAWGGVVMAGAAILVPVLAHHGFLPPQAAMAFAGPKVNENGSVSFGGMEITPEMMAQAVAGFQQPPVNGT